MFIHFDALPPRTTKGTIVRLLVQVGGIDRSRIGSIELRHRGATVEVPESFVARLVKQLDGTSLANQNIRVRAGQGPSNGGDLSDASDHFERLARLLDMEARAEAQQILQQSRRLSAQDAERSGTSLVDLVVTEQTIGLGGRCLTTLSKAGGKDLPWTRLGVGAPVVLSPAAADTRETVRAVVSDRSLRSIEIATEGAAGLIGEHDRFRIDLSADEVTRVRQRAALNRASHASGDRLAWLRQVLLFEKPPAFDPPASVTTLDVEMNASQRAAVERALTARDVAIIHGPPGTGKTRTLVELIRQAVARDKTVLACAPSNLAVDNLLERLLSSGSRAVRLGHPARVLPEFRRNTLDEMVQSHSDVALARKLIREADELRQRAGRHTRAKPKAGARREMRDEARQLVEDARRLEKQVVRHILDTTPILCATTTVLDSEVLGQRTFDLAVVDEACQSVEPGLWIPILRCEAIVLAGDHCQLPPTVVSSEAAREGLSISLLERLMQRLAPTISTQLTTQYRMHREIMGFSSREFYDDSLNPDSSVAEHTLSDLPGMTDVDLTRSPILFLDTAGAGLDEELEPDGESRRNPGEARLVVALHTRLVQAGCHDDQIAVISPYAAQVRLIREMIENPHVEVDSIDGFQGREKEAIVISLVRSNHEGEIGFLADVRRMNVALTRARRKLIVIGDSATIAHHEFYQRMIEYFERRDAYRSVWELEWDWK